MHGNSKQISMLMRMAEISTVKEERREPAASEEKSADWTPAPAPACRDGRLPQTGKVEATPETCRSDNSLKLELLQ